MTPIWDNLKACVHLSKHQHLYQCVLAFMALLQQHVCCHRAPAGLQQHNSYNEIRCSGSPGCQELPWLPRTAQSAKTASRVAPHEAWDTIHCDKRSQPSRTDYTPQPSLLALAPNQEAGAQGTCCPIHISWLPGHLSAALATPPVGRSAGCCCGSTMPFCCLLHQQHSTKPPAPPCPKKTVPLTSRNASNAGGVMYTF